MFTAIPVLQDLVSSSVVAFQPASGWRLAALVLHGSLALYTILASSGSLAEYFLRTTVASKFFAAWHLNWITDPLNDHRHELDTVPARERPFWYRMYWAECVVVGHRAIGSNCQIPYTPPLPAERRWRFVKSRLLRAFGLFLIVDAANTYVDTNPVFSPGSVCDSPLSCQGYKLGLVNMLVVAFAPYAAIDFGYTMLSVVAVAIGFSDARYWPDIFGPVSEAYTVRRFWGRFWHQMLRPFLASIGKSVADSLGLVAGTTASAYTQLFVAFTISGIIHAAGDIRMAENHRSSSFKFFVLQAFAVAFEDSVICLAKKTGLAHSMVFNRLIGYSWVCLWFTLLMPYMIRWCIESGLAGQFRFPFSPSRFLWAVAEKHYGVDIPSLFN